MQLPRSFPPDPRRARHAASRWRCVPPAAGLRLASDSGDAPGTQPARARAPSPDRTRPSSRRNQPLPSPCVLGRESPRAVRRDTRMLRMTEAMRSPHYRAASCGITPSEIKVAQAMIGTAVAAIRMMSRDCRRAIAHLLGSMPLRLLLQQPQGRKSSRRRHIKDLSVGEL